MLCCEHLPVKLRPYLVVSGTLAWSLLLGKETNTFHMAVRGRGPVSLAAVSVSLTGIAREPVLFPCIPIVLLKSAM